MDTKLRMVLPSKGRSDSIILTEWRDNTFLSKPLPIVYSTKTDIDNAIYALHQYIKSNFPQKEASFNTIKFSLKAILRDLRETTVLNRDTHTLTLNTNNSDSLYIRILTNTVGYTCPEYITTVPSSSKSAGGTVVLMFTI